MIKLSGICRDPCGFVGQDQGGERLERWRLKTTGREKEKKSGEKVKKVKNLVIFSKNRLGWCLREEVTEDRNRKSGRKLEQEQRPGSKEGEHREYVEKSGLIR